MAASPIETFIRAHRGDSPEHAFDEFMKTPRISEWAAGDENRVARLRSEFLRAWSRVNGTAPVSVEPVVPASPASPAAPAKREEPASPPAAGEVTSDEQARWARFGRVTQSVMCPNCGSMQLNAHLAGDTVNVKCHRCSTVYADLLELIPVQRVGPFEFVFGEGVKGVATATGLLLALAGLYGVLRWVV